MNTEETAVPGSCIDALAVASGTDFIDAALGIATVLGGLASPTAAIDAPAGDLIYSKPLVCPPPVNPESVTV